MRPEPATRVACDRPVLAGQCRQSGALCETWGRHDAVAVEVLLRHPSISSTDDLRLARRAIVFGKREHDHRVVFGSLRRAEVLDEARGMAWLG